MWKLPAGVEFVLGRLHEAGYQAYVVGGCVRDTLLGLPPKDWDVCTNALPKQMQRVFADCHVIETGLRHGTLTVMVDHEPYEVTTFRVDGEYTDHRHPDEVIFVSDVKEDLARRDFTVNAMAWSPQTGLVDAFGGQEDLKAGLIRCVGDPRKRFDEDALRIMRALRFSSVYGFDIEPETAAAIHEMKETLHGVAGERIRVELSKLLCGKGVGRILRAYKDVIFALFPQMAVMDGFDQRSPFHAYDVWEHTVRTVEHVPPTEVMRLTMLLHDTGKPGSFFVDHRGVGHAWGHQDVSVRIAREVLALLKPDNATRDRVLTLIQHHDDAFRPERKYMLKLLSRFGQETAYQLLMAHRADENAKGRVAQSEIDAQLSRLFAVMDAVVADNLCVAVKDMAINGRDLMAIGYPGGKVLGETLEWLLERLLEERIPNERGVLLRAAEAHLRTLGL